MAGHGHDEGEDDIIVLHQERLLPTMLMAAVISVVTLFGLAQAGSAKFEVTLGKAAYEKVRTSMTQQEQNIPMSTPTAKYKNKQKALSSVRDRSDRIGGTQDEAPVDEHGHDH